MFYATEFDIHADLAAYNKPTVVMVGIVVKLTSAVSINKESIYNWLTRS